MRGVLCECGCNERHALSACIDVSVPGTPTRATIHRRHVPAWRSEMEALCLVANLIKASRREPFRARWEIGKRIEELRFRAALRLHGTKRAERIAFRARLLYHCPQFVTSIFTILGL